jgi:uncharacterized protein YcfL
MKIKNAVFLGAVLGALLAGCASSSSQTAHKSASNVLKSVNNEFIINNIPLDYKVSIVGYNSKFTNNLLHASVDIQNHKQKRYLLEYRFRWFDETGFEVGKTPWLPLSLNAMEYRSIQQIAHTPKAESFKFYIRAKQ